MTQEHNDHKEYVLERELEAPGSKIRYLIRGAVAKRFGVEKTLEQLNIIEDLQYACGNNYAVMWWPYKVAASVDEWTHLMLRETRLAKERFHDE